MKRMKQARIDARPIVNRHGIVLHMTRAWGLPSFYCAQGIFRNVAAHVQIM
jgi:hypothetical protein